MAKSPLKPEEIAFEHPCFLVDPYMVHRTMTCKCNERPSNCKTRNWLSIAAFAVLAACAPKAAAPVPAQQIVGGWQSADPKAEQISAAANFAAGQLPQGHGALAEVVSAQTQVVAGTNIHLVLRLADGSRWKATVWHRLDGTFALTEAVPLP